MNHLAHLFLSGDQPEIIVGNFITDMLSPKEQKKVQGLYQIGIQLHLYIDQTIDHHPVYKKSIDLIKGRQGRYAPVVADIYYDYLLSHHWNEYSDHTYHTFKEKMYDVLKNHLPPDISEKIPERIGTMVERDFLSSYQSNDHIQSTFGFLAKRAKFSHRFDLAHQDYHEMFNDLKLHFHEIFPQMIHLTEKFRNSRIG